jgi:hypothetical protein
MSTQPFHSARPTTAVAEALGQSAYAEIGTVYYWDETGSFSAEAERPWSAKAAPPARMATPALLARLHRAASGPASQPAEAPRRNR